VTKRATSRYNSENAFQSPISKSIIIEVGFTLGNFVLNHSNTFYISFGLRFLQYEANRNGLYNRCTIKSCQQCGYNGTTFNVPSECTVYIVYKVKASKHNIKFTITIHSPLLIEWLIATFISVSHTI